MQYPASGVRTPKRRDGCLVGALIAGILALCACVVFGGTLLLGGATVGTLFGVGSVAVTPGEGAAASLTAVPRGPTAGASDTPRSATPRPAATPSAVDSVFPTAAPGARDKSLQQQTFDQLWNLVNEQYYDPTFGGLDWRGEQAKINQRLQAGMSNAQFWQAMGELVERLGDGHSYFLNPQEAKEDAARYTGEDAYIGIGVSTNFNPDKKWIYVLRVTPGGPADRAGIRPHDLILAIDGKPSVGADGAPQTHLLRGSEGTRVQLRVRTPGKAERELTVPRATIRADVVVDYRLLPGPRKIGYIRVPTFDEKTLRDKVTDALEELMNQSNGRMDGLILDARQNGGGNYPQLAAVLGLFTKTSPGEFVNRKGERDPLEVIDIQYGNSFTVKLMMLIGRDTESFGEIFAGALQNARGARLVGQPSAGNIEMLRAFSLYDGSKASIAIETFRLPDGTNWEGRGLTPDIPVAGAWDEYGADDPDPVLQAAIDALSR